MSQGRFEAEAGFVSVTRLSQMKMKYSTAKTGALDRRTKPWRCIPARAADLRQSRVGRRPPGRWGGGDVQGNAFLPHQAANGSGRIAVGKQGIHLVKETLHKSRRSCLIAIGGVESGYPVTT
ncbi:hypothetical protein [Kushneria sinocarnis]|uniref:hypothetical protein n=1 Tax=Kushneria sinocarnis TaxID=595502 RepID=UPI0011C45213|nr:hypothetical protein [Kushneria sinocarnis]